MKQKKINFISQAKFSKSFKIISTIGQGSYGVVYKAEDQETKELSAIKVFLNQNNSIGLLPNIVREISLLKELNHPNIIKLKGIYLGINEVEINLEYCENDLTKFIKLNKDNPQIYNIETIKNILIQIFRGVSEIHSSGIIHRDLKPSNVLMSNDNTVKIGDFSISRTYNLPYNKYSKEIMTLWYKAPEIFLGSNSYSISIDVWSIGCIFGELLTGNPIFQCDNELSMLNILTEVFGNFITENGLILPGAKYFDFFFKWEEYFVNKKMKGIGLRNYISKNSLFEITEDMFDLLNSLLQIDPTKRISCIEALNHPFFTSKN